MNRALLGKGSRAINVLRIASAPAKLETITIGSDVFEVNVGLGVTAGRISIALVANGTKASGTLTCTANPGNGETVVLDAVTYTFKTTLTGAANEVLIGATAEDSLNNLVLAINAGAGAGSAYGTGTVANPKVTAVEGTDVAATGTLTSDNTNVSNNDTVTIGSKVYTFKTALTPTEGEVLIGGSADASLLNLIRAINHTGTAGTDYSCAAAHTQVSAAASVTSHAFAVTALTVGAAGNLLASTETSSHLSWGAATLASGTDVVTVTAVETGTGGNSLVSTETLAAGSFGGATLGSGVAPTAENLTDAFILAMASNTQRLTATKISANEVLVSSVTATNRTLACTETLAGANNAWAAAAMYGGDAEHANALEISARVPLAQEVTLGNMHFLFPFNVANVIPLVRVTSSGVTKAWDGGVTITGKRVTLDNVGSTDWATTDTVTVLASE